MSAPEDGCRRALTVSFFLVFGSWAWDRRVAKTKKRNRKKCPTHKETARFFATSFDVWSCMQMMSRMTEGEWKKDARKGLPSSAANIASLQRNKRHTRERARRLALSFLFPLSPTLSLSLIFPHPLPSFPKQALFPPRTRPARPLKGLSASRRLKRYWSRHARRRRRTP